MEITIKTHNITEEKYDRIIEGLKKIQGITFEVKRECEEVDVVQGE